METIYMVAVEFDKEEIESTVCIVPNINSERRREQQIKKDCEVLEIDLLMKDGLVRKGKEPRIDYIGDFKFDIIPVAYQKTLSLIKENVIKEMKEGGVVYPFGQNELIFMTEEMITHFLNRFSMYEDIFNKIKSEVISEYDNRKQEAVESYLELVFEEDMKNELFIEVDANIPFKKMYEKNLNIKFNKLSFQLNSEIEDQFLLASLRIIVDTVEILLKYYKQKDFISEYVLDFVSKSCKRILERNIMHNETVAELLDQLESIHSFGRYERTKKKYEEIRRKAFSLVSKKGYYNFFDVM